MGARKKFVWTAMVITGLAVFVAVRRSLSLAC
jgi:hypothetical protein